MVGVDEWFEWWLQFVCGVNGGCSLSGVCDGCRGSGNSIVKLLD